LEIKNAGFDIFYLDQGPGRNVRLSPNKITPDQMIRIENVIRPSIPNIQKIGLVGYGSQSQVILLPLTFYTK
jgi:hypothetical protein